MARTSLLFKFQSLGLAILLLLLGCMGVTDNVPSEEDDCGDLRGLGVLLGCLNFIRKDRSQLPPSPECCNYIKQFTMKCTCQIITKEIEETISMEKLVYVAKSCGYPLSPGTKCGSKFIV